MLANFLGSFFDHNPLRAHCHKVLPLDCLLTPLPSPPSWDPLNCLETRSRSFWNPLSRLFWAAAFGRRPEESRGEGPEASRASFETVDGVPGGGSREGGHETVEREGTECDSGSRPGFATRRPLASSDALVVPACSKDHNNRTPPLTFRTYQILPHTHSYFHCLYSYLDLLQ